MTSYSNPISAANAAATFSAAMPVEVSGEPGNRTVTCPDTVVEKGLKKVRLDWEVLTEDWEVIGVHGLFYPEFTNKSRDGDDYKCIDKNRHEKDHKYTLVVGNTKTDEVVLLDPTIRNGGVK
jgi:hypothetical protein